MVRLLRLLLVLGVWAALATPVRGPEAGQLPRNPKGQVQACPICPPPPWPLPS